MRRHDRFIFFCSDFVVTYPTKGVQVVNGQTFPVTWSKGLLDGVDSFDLELTRMGTDGLIYVARDSASQEYFRTSPFMALICLSVLPF